MIEDGVVGVVSVRVAAVVVVSVRVAAVVTVVSVTGVVDVSVAATAVVDRRVDSCLVLVCVDIGEAAIVEDASLVDMLDDWEANPDVDDVSWRVIVGVCV